MPARFSPPKDELKRIYQTKTMNEIAQHYGVGETVVHKRIHEYGIVLRGVGKGGHRHRKGRIRTEKHKQNLSKALRAYNAICLPENRPNWKGGPVEKVCKWCGVSFTVPRARRKTAMFCSNSCRTSALTENYHGSGHPRWVGDGLTTGQRHEKLHPGSSARHKAKRRQCAVAWANDKAIELIYAKAAEKDIRTKITHQVDHRIPCIGSEISPSAWGYGGPYRVSNVKGFHVEWNLQIMTAKKNNAKRNHYSTQDQDRESARHQRWLRQRGLGI